MKNGYLWDDDEENMALQAHAKKTCAAVQRITAGGHGRAALLPKLFGEVGKNVLIGPNVWIGANRGILF